MCRSRRQPDRKSTRLNSSHTEIYTLSLHDALPIWPRVNAPTRRSPSRMFGSDRSVSNGERVNVSITPSARSEEHTSELQSHRDLHSFPTRRSSDLATGECTDQEVALAHVRQRPFCIQRRARECVDHAVSQIRRMTLPQRQHLPAMAVERE